ncbi:hypothetical protein V3C99_016057, partial [Haemonchus contortus]
AVVNLCVAASLRYDSFSTVGYGWIWRNGWIRRYASSSSSAAAGRF